ncbi:MAG: aminotransferase class III-fold pyridoxal phosphate-dependent enzyme, partial [Planctomycetota bacterium]
MAQTRASGLSDTRVKELLATLRRLRSLGGEVRTRGLSDEIVERFLGLDPALATSVERAEATRETVEAHHPDVLAMGETDQIRTIQASIVNFYGRDAVNPYVPLAACGPWVVTSRGAVIHDSGGYGMLGQGHTPSAVLEVLGRPQVMANVMTAQFSQLGLIRRLRGEVGQTRGGTCPYTGFLFMNSGSEAVAVAARLSDANAKDRTDPGGAHAGKPIKHLALAGGFHGRTQRPAHFSDSTRTGYEAHLATFRDRSDFLTVEPNDVDGLRETFDRADAEGFFIEAVFVEPVMGEGNPGLAMTREFYDEARALTAAHGSLLLVDSIQAGLRAYGVLSVIDYPGFQGCEPPDMETWSKALNAGQYPMSVLAMRPGTVDLFRPGLYGNTMTAAPRALDVASTVLDVLTPQLRANIRERGKEFLARMGRVAEELAGRITRVQGTGLLMSCALDPERYRAHGKGSTEEYLRERGLGVIHGGPNSLRFTPHFAVTSEEIGLIVDGVRDAL